MLRGGEMVTDAAYVAPNGLFALHEHVRMLVESNSSVLI
jgi:hypothetical protein